MTALAYPAVFHDSLSKMLRALAYPEGRTIQNLDPMVVSKPQNNKVLVHFLGLKAVSFSAFFCTQGPGKANAKASGLSGCDHALSPACSSLKSFEMLSSLFIICSSILPLVLAKSCLLWPNPEVSRSDIPRPGHSKAYELALLQMQKRLQVSGQSFYHCLKTCLL